MPVDRPGKHDTGDRGHGGRLSRTAPRPLSAWWRRLEPGLLAVVEAEREQAAADLWIGKRRRAVRYGDASEVGERDVDIGLVRRGAPLHAAVDAALANRLPPDHLALTVGI